MVPVSLDGVVMARCRDATIYNANVGPRCILGFPFFACYGIHINMEPPWFLFEEHVGKVVTPNGLAGRRDAPSSHIRVQQPQHRSSARGASTATDVNDAERPAILEPGLCAIGNFDRVFVATSPSVPPASQLAGHSQISDGLSEPPMVLETPLHQVSPSRTLSSPTAKFLSCVLALCTAGAALQLSNQSDINSAQRIPRSISTACQYKKNISSLRVIAHVDWPWFHSMKVYSILCMSAAILMYAPAATRAAIECVTHLFEQHEPILYESLRNYGNYFTHNGNFRCQSIS